MPFLCKSETCASVLKISSVNRTKLSCSLALHWPFTYYTFMKRIQCFHEEFFWLIMVQVDNWQNAPFGYSTCCVLWIWEFRCIGCVMGFWTLVIMNWWITKSILLSGYHCFQYLLGFWQNNTKLNKKSKLYNKNKTKKIKFNKRKKIKSIKNALLYLTIPI